MRRFAETGLAIILTVGALIVGVTPDALADLAQEVLALTGARTKVVWVHSLIGKGHGWDAITAEYELMGFDTAEGKARVILSGPASYANPCISPNGQTVFFTDATTSTIHCVNWDGTGHREFTKGYVLCPWTNPEDGSAWLYFTAEGYSKGPVARCRMDDPSVREVVWSKDQATHTLSVSADGTRAGSGFPWPLAGVAILPNVSWRQYGNGCNGCIAPDNSYKFMHMGEEVSHGGVIFYDDGGTNRRAVWMRNFPGVSNPNTDSWVPRWTSDVRFLTVNAPIGGENTNIYLGQFDDDFTQVKRWIRVSYLTGHNAKAYGWIHPGAGQYSGEVPYTIEVPERLASGGGWAWDFGDGTKAQGPHGKHTYRTPGSYTITATRGEQTLRGYVNARPRKEPAVVAVQLFDDRCLQVQFDERVRGDNAKFLLKSGVKITSAKIDGEGFRAILAIDGKLRDSDTLRIEGVRDYAQEPNILSKDIKITCPRWPAVRTGLVFMWEGNRKQSFNWNARSLAFEDNTIHHWSLARFDRYGAMVLDGGTYRVRDAGSGIYNRCNETGQITVESVITPFNLYQGNSEQPSVVLGFGRTNEKDFSFVQEGDRLFFLIRLQKENARWGELQRVELCTLKRDAAHHVIATFANNTLTCYLNGKAVKQEEFKATLALKEPDFEMGLHMGGLPGTLFAWGSAYPWRGKLEGIAVYSTAIDAAQAAQNYAVYEKILAARPASKQIHVKAKLAAKSQIPAASEIAPYRDALVINEYDVVRVTQGQYGDPKIRVLQWGLLDTRSTWLAGAEVGQEFDMALEEYAEHPELEGEVKRDTLDENFDMDLYVDVTRRPSGEPRAAKVTVHPRQLWMPPNWKQQFSVSILDQYGNPIQAPAKWSVKPGGQLDVGTAYGAARWFEARDKAGSGAIGADGLFTSDATAGVVTVLATAPDTPEAVGTAVVGIDNWPAIHAAPQQAMRFGIDQHFSDRSKFTGDIDRIRIHNRTLSADEIATHAAGKLGDATGLVGDWTFDDPPKDGAFPNVAGEGLAAKLNHFDPKKSPEHIREGDRGFVRLDGQGYLEVPPDPRLDMTRHCTVEAWIRNANGMLVCKQVAWMWGFVFWVNPHGLATDALRVHVSPLECAYDFPKDTWTHVAAVFDVNGHWMLYAGGKLVGEKKLDVLIIYE